jgi:hypothetical protein
MQDKDNLRLFTFIILALLVISFLLIDKKDTKEHKNNYIYHHRF